MHNRLERIRRKMQAFEFSVDTKGNHFIAIIVDDFVIKVPRDKFSIDRLDTIADAHNYLYGKIEGALPCVKYDSYLVIPKAPGVRVSKLKNNKQREIKSRIRRICKEARKLGYIINDVKIEDTFYDDSTDTVYMVDFSNVKSTTA